MSLVPSAGRRSYQLSLFERPELRSPHHDDLAIFLDEQLRQSCALAAALAPTARMPVARPPVWQQVLRGRGATLFCDIMCVIDGWLEDARCVGTYAQTPNGAGGLDRQMFSPFRTVDEEAPYCPRTVVATAFFEIKPTIPSIGELLQQINFYRSTDTFRGATNARFWVVAPSDQVSERILAQQNIGFLPAPHTLDAG